jgi:hypothetical protein
MDERLALHKESALVLLFSCSNCSISCKKSSGTFFLRRRLHNFSRKIARDSIEQAMMGYMNTPPFVIKLNMYLSRLR